MDTLYPAAMWPFMLMKIAVKETKYINEMQGRENQAVTVGFRSLISS